jgi:hypothetical protein
MKAAAQEKRHSGNQPRLWLSYQLSGGLANLPSRKIERYTEQDRMAASAKRPRGRERLEVVWRKAPEIR